MRHHESDQFTTNQVVQSVCVCVSPCWHYHAGITTHMYTHMYTLQTHMCTHLHDTSVSMHMSVTPYHVIISCTCWDQCPCTKCSYLTQCTCVCLLLCSHACLCVSLKSLVYVLLLTCVFLCLNTCTCVVTACTSILSVGRSDIQSVSQ